MPPVSVMLALLLKVTLKRFSFLFLAVFIKYLEAEANLDDAGC